MKKAKSPLAPIIVLFLAGTVFPKTEIHIGVSPEEGAGKTKIALAQFLPLRTENRDDLETAMEMRKVVRSDLLLSRYFDIIQEPFSPANVVINEESLEFWKKTGSSRLVTAKAADYGKVWTLEAKIYDLGRQRKTIVKRYQGPSGSERLGAHSLSNDIILAVTGNKPISKSKIVFANDSTGKKEIYMVDYDGEGLTRLTNSRSISILPKWSSDGNRIYYTTYKHYNPDMFVIDLKKGTVKPYITFQGLNIAGRDSPGGDKMVLTLSLGKDPNVYVFNRETMRIKKLLSLSFGISSTPTYSPDEKQIAFVSDMAGNPQIYVYDIGAKSAERITDFNWCDSPAWSPGGEWIAFSGRKTRKENLNIFIIDPTGSVKYRLTRDSGDNENPSWSPDGRFLAFTTNRRGKREIYVMDRDGSAQHPLTELKGNSYTPDWSP